MKTRAIFLRLIILCLVSYIVFISVRQPADYFFLGSGYEVHVTNGFRNNSSLPLVIWCASGADDIGGRALQEGDDFSWSVKTNLWGTTLFSCTMKWDRMRKRFNAFQAHRDSHRCAAFRKCFWLVKEDGFYFSNDGVNWKKDFSWS